MPQKNGQRFYKMKKKPTTEAQRAPYVSESESDGCFWEDLCILCGASVPEGYMICPMCLREGPPTEKRGRQSKEGKG